MDIDIPHREPFECEMERKAIAALLREISFTIDDGHIDCEEVVTDDGVCIGSWEILETCDKRKRHLKLVN
jgi:hypothetical protein